MDGTVILIVTEGHRQAIKRYLRVEVQEASGQLLFFDAAALMSFLMKMEIQIPHPSRQELEQPSSVLETVKACAAGERCVFLAKWKSLVTS